MKTNGTLKRIGSLLAAGAMVVGILSGCGSSTTSSSSGEGDKKDVTTVKVATYNAMPPYCYIDADGNLTGYDVAVLKAIDEKLEDYSFDIQGMEFNTIITGLESGTLDLGSCQFVKSAARIEKFAFPEESFCLSPMVLVVKAGSGIKTMADMAGKSILTSPSSYEYSMLVNYNKNHPGEELELHTVSDSTTADNYRMIANGQVDAALSYVGTFQEVNSQLGLDLVMTDVVMVEETYEMLSADNTELAEAMSGALAEMKADGTLSQLATEYLGEDVFTLYSGLVSLTAE